MPAPAYLPQAAEAVLVALYERDLGDAIRAFPSTASALTDDYFAVVVRCRIDGIIAYDPDPAKTTYRLKADIDVQTIADRENEGEDAILAGIQQAMRGSDPTGLPLEPFSDFVVLPNTSLTDMTLEVDGRRVRRLSYEIGVQAAS